MVPQKFAGATSREVLQKVRQALGDDALIVSNNPVAGGVEITALAARVLAADSPSQRPRRLRVNGIETEGVVQQMMTEIAAMKSMLQRELGALAWSDLPHRAPARAAAVQSLLNAGFSAHLTRELAAQIPGQASDKTASHTVTARLEERLQVGAADELVQRGGIYALVGPTGVGKTTTLAKLAARCVVRHGASSLALLTTDSYRIAAHDQLRIYGRILGVPVHAIKDAADMRVTLEELGDKHTVLIDTTGMSQRDRMVAEQNALLGAADRIKRLLLLNATANAATLEDVVHCYAREAVHGCIVTKVDESPTLGTVVDSIVRHKLTVHYVTNGQRVPEDIHLPNRTYLLHRAMHGAVEGLQADEASLMMAAQGGVHV